MAKHIAVNTRFLLRGGLEGMGRFTHEILKRLVRGNPDVQFSFFFDRPFDDQYIYGDNVTPYVLFPPARHPILFRIWFNYSVARKLRHLKPDVFFSPDGFLSLRTEVPQVPVFHDLAFMHYPEDNKPVNTRYYHHFWPKFAEKAAHILAVSNYTRQDVQQQFGVAEDKISVVYNACDTTFHPIPEAEQQAVRDEFSGGTPYFHFVGAIHPRKNLVNLIAAFNRFKETTGLPHKLMLVGRKAWDTVKVIHSYEASSWKDDIQFTGFVSDQDLNRIYSASTALCYVPYFEGFGIPILEAMHSETPVICSNVTSMPEVAGDAALLVDPFAPDQISEAMKSLAHDPALRDSLIHKGRARREIFSWENSANQTMSVLEMF